MNKLGLIALFVACAKYEAAPAPAAGSIAEDEKKETLLEDAAMIGAPAPKRMATRKKSKAGARGLDPLMEADEAAPAEEEPIEGEEEPAPSRSWFPETFLFEPLVKTDAEGRAKVEVDVPDRLTSWRVLALAHSREGAQAGAVTTFLGTLPTYVDPIVPSFLISGDILSIPIQVVNTTEHPVTATLKLSATGAALSEGSGEVSIAAQGSIVRYAELRANAPGSVLLSASLGKEDAIERTIPVLPIGEPRTIEKSGTLAAPRELSIEMPPNTDPKSARVRLTVFPGALAIVRSELESGLARGGVADDAYLLLLAGNAKSLLAKLGGTADDAWLRKLGIIASQRVIRHARAPDPATAALLAEAALAHPDSPVLGRLGERLASQLANSQRPDGTFQGGNGWTLQRLLVTTADSVRAVRAAETREGGKRRAEGVRLKANGAFERHLRRIEDPYTAASVLVSGAVEGSMKELLIERVKKAIAKREDGSKYVPVPATISRPDGYPPSELETTALAALALKGDPEAPALLPDLGASILSAYRPSTGFGDGYSNSIALLAVLEIFDEPLPLRVKIDLTIDGRSLASGDLAGDKLKEVLALDAPLLSPAGAHAVKVTADPPVPGLGFAISFHHYVPWSLEEASDGLELSVDLSKDASVGRPIDVTLTAIAPATMALSIRQALPAGVEVDRPSLDALVSNGVITRYETEDGRVTLETPSRAQGQTFVARYRVIPTLAGTLHTSASSIAPLEKREGVFHVPPTTWHVKR